MNLLKSQTEFLKQYGLKIDEQRLLKFDSHEKVEFIKDAIKSFLNEQLQNVMDKISEHRKKGIDFFIEELQMIQCKAKLKLAIANFDVPDIQTYMKKIKLVETSVNQKIPQEIQKTE